MIFANWRPLVSRYKEACQQGFRNRIHRQTFDYLSDVEMSLGRLALAALPQNEHFRSEALELVNGFAGDLEVIRCQLLELPKHLRRTRRLATTCDSLIVSARQIAQRLEHSR